DVEWLRRRAGHFEARRCRLRAAEAGKRLGDIDVPRIVRAGLLGIVLRQVVVVAEPCDGDAPGGADCDPRPNLRSVIRVDTNGLRPRAPAVLRVRIPDPGRASAVAALVPHDVDIAGAVDV